MCVCLCVCVCMCVCGYVCVVSVGVFVFINQLYFKRIKLFITKTIQTFLYRRYRKKFPCKYCQFDSKRRYYVKSEEKASYKNEINQAFGLSSHMLNKNNYGSGYNVDNIHGVFVIHLKETFKQLFLDNQDVERWYLYPICLKIHT